ncbi:MAG TPA: glycosyltransferase, partial [Longimicrobiaceae bacterium]|nr:glycosyltransferase [Longimicrobiaceae bacterium]
MTLVWSALEGYNYFLLGYFTFVNATYFVLTIGAYGGIRRYVRRLNAVDSAEVLQAAGAPPVTMIAPAHNEERSCVQMVRALLALDYPDHEIVLVDDGSTDDTLGRLLSAFEMEPAFRAATAELPHQPVRGVFQSRTHPNLWVVEKDNGGTADALNAAINLSHTPLVCRVDADCILEADALIRAVRPCLEDDSTVAVGGIVRVANGCRVEAGRIVDIRLPVSLLAQFQVIEYLRSFYAVRIGWAGIGATLLVSGAFGVFRRRTLVEAGGFRRSSITEDMELTLRLHRHCREARQPYRMVYIPDPVLWTEVPERLGDLGRQRDRWHRGLIDLLRQHRVMFFNPRYGRVGTLAYPYLLLVEALGPVIEFTGYFAFLLFVLFGDPSPMFILGFLLLVFGTGACLSAATVGLQELVFRRYHRGSDLLRLIGLSLLEVLGYRQILTYFRFRGTISYLLGRQGWGTIERKGFDSDSPAAVASPARGEPGGGWG